MNCSCSYSHTAIVWAIVFIHVQCTNPYQRSRKSYSEPEASWLLAISISRNSAVLTCWRKLSLSSHMSFDCFSNFLSSSIASLDAGTTSLPFACFLSISFLSIAAELTLASPSASKCHTYFSETDQLDWQIHDLKPSKIIRNCRN
jgi:hypothetical protein